MCSLLLGTLIFLTASGIHGQEESTEASWVHNFEISGSPKVAH
jgi:hypothetical protein